LALLGRPVYRSQAVGRVGYPSFSPVPNRSMSGKGV
jgi:hypothetical protein